MPKELEMDGVYVAPAFAIPSAYDKLDIDDNVIHIIMNEPRIFMEVYVPEYETWTDQVKEESHLLLQNYHKYGYTDCLGWAIEHWGTKWNAYDIVEKPYGVYFETARCIPLPIYKALSCMFNREYIAVRWANEDTGNDTGVILLKDGNIVSGGAFTPYSQQAYRNYIEAYHGGVMPSYYFWEEDGTLGYKDED